MNRTSIARSLAAGASMFMLLPLPGCIVGEIRDGINESNAQLASINESFAKVERANELLERVDSQLAGIAVSLESIDTKLGSVDQDLDDVEGQMQSIGQTLNKLDVHLASLRRTINNIDSVVPFLRITGDDRDDKDALDAPEEAPKENEGQQETPPAGQPGG